MSEILLSEDVMEAWVYVLETMIFCCSVEAMADADFSQFVFNLQHYYPAEYEAVLEVLRKRGDSNGL